MGRCQRLTLTEGSWGPLTPPSRVTAPPPHLNGEGSEMIEGIDRITYGVEDLARAKIAAAQNQRLAAAE